MFTDEIADLYKMQGPIAVLQLIMQPTWECIAQNV